MIRTEIRETVGLYLNEMMKLELTGFLGRKLYERKDCGSNHRNWSYSRSFTMRGVGRVGLKVPRDREAQFHNQVIPRSRQMEDELRKDVCFMFLTGISTWSLSMISKQLLGRKISPSQVSLVSKELIDAVEEWICLQTTNVIERLNKEFNRRTKPMEIVAGERACYTLLAFICLKMELHWRIYSRGKRVSNLPSLQNLHQTNFTQSS